MRDFQSYNDAFLAKISWRLLRNPHYLLGRVLSGKYFPSGTILQASETSACSHGWRSILIGRDLLKKNLGWAIGNGLSISIWQDPWLCLNKQERPMGPRTEQSSTLCVADLLLPNGTQWDHNKIQLLLPEYEDKIICLKPSLTGASDKQIWLGTKSGDYSVKSGYYIAIEEELEPIAAEMNFDWHKSIWSLDCAPKVKMFVWKLIKGAIPVGERLIERHIEVDPKCKRCGCSESILHLLFQCQFAQKVWQLASFDTELDLSGTIDLMLDWPSLCLLKTLPPTEISRGTLFPWILWSLWKARNRFTFEGFSASPEDTLTAALRLAREWSTYSKAEISAGQHKREREIPIPTGTEVVRTDAAWCAERRAADLGWLILPPHPTRSFQKRMPFIASPLMAEGLALREAITHCKRLQKRHVRFESDSALFVKSINSEDPIVELHSVVMDILFMAQSFDSVSFVWIFRKKMLLLIVWQNLF